ncbi:F-box/LRR-repeat protein 2 [Podospora conica]|nr:F-box/LRR-repeat protein 2 [Schizothecium conicum]
MADLNATNHPPSTTPPVDVNTVVPFPPLPDVVVTDGDAGSGAGSVADGGGHDGAGPQQAKKSNRHRLLRGIQRISSSPSLALSRPRASSSPYPKHGTLSCVSLASSPSPFGQPSTGSSYFSHISTADGSAPTSVSGTSTPGTTPGCDDDESAMAIRKVKHPITTPTIAALPVEIRKKTRVFNLWASLPYEIKIHVLSFLQPKELVRVSPVSRDFYKTCFDGQLWTSFNASEFYKDIPPESLSKIIVAAGPFIKDLNLRGCVQVEQGKLADTVVKACRNLINATLEGCRNFHRSSLHTLLKSNQQLANLNLTGLTAVTNVTCKIISQSCPHLETFNVSWCKHMDARGIKMVVEGCPRLSDLRAGEIKGFDNLDVAQAIFETNNLERLVLAGCAELNDAALKTMVHGANPTIDILTDRPIVPPRKLRHLDLSRCSQLTTLGVKALGYNVPDLEGLQLSMIMSLTDDALEPILKSTPKLTHLELEDVGNLTNRLFSEHLAKAPCAPILEHLSISNCGNLGDSGMIPVFRHCTNLRSVYMDNTPISDLTLTGAAAMVRERESVHPLPPGSPPQVGLHLVVYDCTNVAWSGVLEVLSRNAGKIWPAIGAPGTPGPPSEIVTLKCFYGWQMTVDEHTKRVLRGDVASAVRLERKWADYMQANEEAGVAGANGRRRRRRLREAQQVHANEEELAGGGTGRRRARTAGCSMM